MAYPRTGNHLNFFIPNLPLASVAAEVLKEMDIGAASADHGELVCVRSCVVKQIGFVLTGEAAGGSGTAPTVIFTKRPTPLSSSGEAVVGTLTVAHGTAIGKVVYENLAAPVKFAVGDSMELSHTVGVTGPTGMGLYFFICDEDPEVPGNNSDMVAG